MKAIKTRIFQIISKANDGDKLSHAFDIFLIALIFCSVLSIVLESFNSLAERYAAAFRAFETFSVVVFTLEYLARIWTADLLYPNVKHPRLKYVCSLMAIFDLLAILPFYVPFITADLRFFRMFRLIRLTRLFRLAKLGRYVESLRIIGEVMKASATQLLAAIGACLLIVVFASILMYTVENQAQPDTFPNVIASLWWAVCTLTTVGYGDVYPITGLGRFLAAIISIMGIGIVAIPTGIITAGFNAAMAKRKGEGEDDPKRFCPYCGHKLGD